MDVSFPWLVSDRLLPSDWYVAYAMYVQYGQVVSLSRVLFRGAALRANGCYAGADPTLQVACASTVTLTTSLRSQDV